MLGQRNNSEPCVTHQSWHIAMEQRRKELEQLPRRQILQVIPAFSINVGLSPTNPPNTDRVWVFGEKSKRSEKVGDVTIERRSPGEEEVKRVTSRDGR